MIELKDNKINQRKKSFISLMLQIDLIQNHYLKNRANKLQLKDEF